ncbi:MAG: hypothetical protein HKN93_03780, partial [Acidimicrobiia bacterium]|nr:hypothetical protein [Acidimicrobiia bacterium]
TQPTAFGVEGTYSVISNLEDPAWCSLPFTGGYTDLAGFGIFAQSDIVGDTVSFSAFDAQNPFEFYGDPSTGMSFTDDGFAYFDSTPGGSPWQPTLLPTESDPNDMMAVHWTDMEIVYDFDTNSGVSLATAGPELSILEYDNMTTWPAGSTDRSIDFEIISFSTIDPNGWEFAYAYSNVEGDWSGVPGVVGAENETGTAATQVYAGDVGAAGLEGLVLCFDYEGPTFADVQITYSASVDKTLLDGAELTNGAISSVSNLFGADETSAVTVTVPVLEGGLAGVLIDGAMGTAVELVGLSTDRMEIRYLFQAWFDLWVSSYSRLWIEDGNALDYRFGGRVFVRHASAVTHMLQAEAREGNAADGIGGVIDQLVNLDGALAELQLAKAIDTGADPGRVDAAGAALEAAYAALEAGLPADAIGHFGTAWEEATAGILRLP